MKRGFTIMEMLVWAVASAGLATAIIYMFSHMAEAASPPSITQQGHLYNRSPSNRVLGDAMNLHRRLRRSIADSDAVYVFGGIRGDPGVIMSSSNPAAEAAPVTTTLVGYLPTALPQTGGDPRLFGNSFDVRRLIGMDNFQAQILDGADFSIFCVMNDGTVDTVTQCRRQLLAGGQRPPEFPNDDAVVYEVLFYVPGLSTAEPQEAYRFYLPPTMDVWALPVGARHFWFRYDAVSVGTETSWHRREEGPIRVVFPDPFSLPTEDTGARAKPVSRFIYTVLTHQ